MRVVFTAFAERDLTDAVEHYDTISRGIGDRLVAEVRAATEFIGRYPESSPAIEKGVRRKVLTRFPYDLFYIIEAEEVIVLSVAHESRRPGSWRHRER